MAAGERDRAGALGGRCTGRLRGRRAVRPRTGPRARGASCRRSSSGTSVGAINSAYLAADAHLPAEEALAGGLDRWRDISKGKVIRPILARQVPLTAHPLRGRDPVAARRAPAEPARPEAAENNLHGLGRLEGAPQNVRYGLVEAVAIVTTAASPDARSCSSRARRSAKLHRSHVIDYVPAKLTDEHVRASAAIPILFPPIRVNKPRRGARLVLRRRHAAQHARSSPRSTSAPTGSS